MIFKKLNKRGNFPDIVEWIAVAFAMAIVIVIAVLIFNKFNDQVQITPNETIPQTVKDISQGAAVGIPPLWDYLFLGILMVFVIFSVTAARLIPSKKEFIMISLLFLIVLPFAAMIIENMWDPFSTQSEISTVLDGFVFLPFIMDNLRIVVLVYSFIVAASLLTKDGGSQG